MTSAANAVPGVPALPMGDAPGYVGGPTSSDGVGDGEGSPGVPTPDRGFDEAPPTPPPDPAAVAPRQSRSRSVGLDDADWDCGWPEEADDAQIDTQVVVVRVAVDEQGHPVRAAAVTDPGSGFAKSAVDCALQRHYRPALDHTGQPVLATSPPIRVRFTR